MSVQVKCGCGQAFAAKPHLYGKTVACPVCGQPISIPAGGEADVPLQPQDSTSDPFWDDLSQVEASMPASPPNIQHMPKMSYEYNLREGRTYIHHACGGVTCINGHDFAGLCNPFDSTRRTYCAACDSPDLYSNFSWEDTGERLTEFRKRIRNQSPFIFNLLGGFPAAPLFGAIIGVIVGGLVALKFPNLNMMGASVAGGVAGAFLFFAMGSELVQFIAGKRFYATR